MYYRLYRVVPLKSLEAMEIVPNQLLDGKSYLAAMGEAMESVEEDARAGQVDVLDVEIEKMLLGGKGWSAEERQKYIDELINGPELPLFADSSDDMVVDLQRDLSV